MIYKKKGRFLCSRIEKTDSRRYSAPEGCELNNKFYQKKKKMAYDEPKSKKFKRSVITEHMYSTEFQELFFKHWHNCTAVKTENLEIIPEPFRVCKISNFLKGDELMEEIKNELLDVKSRRNCIDLYQFEQTNDLANVDSNNLNVLFETFQTDLISWMERNTKIDLNKTISISSSCYSDTDFLLCHDDNMGDRRIAFILYLSKDWEAADGGALELFDTDEYGLPRDVVHSLVPEYNSLVFFEVTENSFHQVAEVTSPDKCRWSINGWFHGPLIEKARPQRPNFDTVAIEPKNTKFDLEQWIATSYLKPDVVADVKIKVEFESCAFLTNFLLPDVYEELSQEVIDENIRWKKVGPADQRKYEVAEEETVPEKFKEFCELFKSIVMFEMLKKLTELDLVPDKESMNPKMRMELQRWTAGCYTLISDNQINDNNSTRSETKSWTNLGVGEGPKPKREFRSKLFSGDAAGDNCLGEAVNTPPSSEDEADVAIFNRRFAKSKKKFPSPYQAASSGPKDSASKNILANVSDSDEADVEENGDDEMKLRVLNRKPMKLKRSFHQATSSSNIKISPSKFEMNRGTDSEESDIEDYLSDPNEHDDEDKVSEISTAGGSLDVILQFHSHNAPENVTIDYMSPKEENILIHVPPKDNYLCLAYKTGSTCRVHNYVNHYCRGYYYNLLCTYYE